MVSAGAELGIKFHKSYGKQIKFGHSALPFHFQIPSQIEVAEFDRICSAIQEYRVSKKRGPFLKML